MQSFANLSRTSRLALLFVCCYGGAFGQVLTGNRMATDRDYVDKLPADKKNAIVVISGDKGSGTGFFAKIRGNVFLVTNMHVLSGQTSIAAKTMDGTNVQIAGIFGARDADIALLKLTATPGSYFEMEESVNTANKSGDLVLVPGNSLGGGTVLQTEGRIVALGPVKIEHDAPTFHGNSGSPILNQENWKVLGVDTESITVSMSDSSDSASARKAGSQIKSSVRLFGYRLDNVSQWEGIEWARFSQQSKRLEEADSLVTSIHAVLRRDERGWKNNTTVSNAMNSMRALLNKSRVSTTEISAKAETVVLNFRNSLRRVEQEALESKQSCYGYIVLHYQSLGEYAKALREVIDADKIR